MPWLLLHWSSVQRDHNKIKNIIKSCTFSFNLLWVFFSLILRPQPTNSCCLLFCLLPKSTVQTCATTNYIQMHNNTTGNLTMLQFLSWWLGCIFVVTIEMSSCVSRGLLFWSGSAALQLYPDRLRDTNRSTDTLSQSPCLEWKGVFFLCAWSSVRDTWRCWAIPPYFDKYCKVLQK